MTSHKTVLILEAGASRPYLLPTGGELRDLLLQRNSNSIVKSLQLSGPDQQFYADWYQGLLRDHIAQEQIEHFRRRFAESEFLSIDRFLAFNPEFDDIGRFMIAAILLSCERTPHLKGDWYQILFNELTTEGPDIPVDLLSVVTFNYDRSLEWYLFRSFRAAFDLSDDKAWKRVQQIKIVHVYGDLGARLWRTAVNKLNLARGVAPQPLLNRLSWFDQALNQSSSQISTASWLLLFVLFSSVLLSIP